MSIENKYYASLLDCLLDEVNIKRIEIQTVFICDDQNLSLIYDGDFKFMLGGKDVTTDRLLTLVPQIVDRVIDSYEK